MSDAKEKAKELVDFYKDYPLKEIWAKQCALFCVDEIVKEYESLVLIFMSESDDKLSYWQEVKQEIEKL